MILPRGIRLRPSVALVVCAAALASQVCQAASLAELVKGLSSPDAKTRAEAVDELGSLGAEAQSASASLQAALKDRSPEVRWRAARALGGIIPASPTTIDALVASLKDEDAQTRAYAGFALGQLGARDRNVVDALAAMIADPDPIVRRAALRSLRSLHLPREVTIPLFASTLSSADRQVAMAAVQTIAEGGQKSVPFLRDALANPKAAYWAVVALGCIGPEAADAATEIGKLLSSDQAEVRLEACMALGAIGPPASLAAPALAKALTGDPAPGVRYAAAYAIGGVAANDPAAVGALQAAGKSNDAFMKMVSAWALAKINPQDKAQVGKAVALLVDGLKSDKPAMRMAALEALGGLKASPEVVGPALVSTLKDSDPQVAARAIDMLGAMGAQLTPEIIKALKVPALRGYALRIIDRFGSEAKSAVPDLIELLKQSDLDPQLRRETHFALGQIGPASAPATPHLIAALGSDNERVRNSALFALGRIGPGAYTAVPALEKLSGVEDEFLRVASLWALVGIEPGDAALAAKATPELIKGLSSEREVVRLESSRTLGALGPAAKQALPALRPLVDDPSAAVAGTAAQAIEAIEGRKSPAGGAPSGATSSGSAPAGSAPAGSATPGSGAPAGAPAPGASGRALPARQPVSAPRPGR